MGAQPALEALRVGHAAVQGDHGVRAIERRKARQKACLQLRCEVDFRHHHQHLRIRVGRQLGRHGVQIDLGLAAAGGAKQQEGSGFGLDLRQHLGLLGAQGLGRLYGCVCQVDCRRLALEAALHLQRREVAQLRRQGGECHFADRTLVILGGKDDQLLPGRTQRCDALQGAGNIAHLLRVDLASGVCRAGFPDHAQGLAPAQWHAHQGAWGQRLRAAVGQHRSQRRVRRGLHQNAKPGVHGEKKKNGKPVMERGWPRPLGVLC